MNKKAEISQAIVKAIEGFPKVYHFLVSGDTGCHPQHLVDTIADEVVAKTENDITHLVTVYGYDEEMVTITRCICGQTFEPWDFTLSDEPKGCPNCRRRLCGSIQVKVYEAEEE